MNFALCCGRLIEQFDLNLIRMNATARCSKAHVTFHSYAVIQLRTNKGNKFIDRFIGTSRDFFKVRKPSE